MGHLKRVLSGIGLGLFGVSVAGAAPDVAPVARPAIAAAPATPKAYAEPQRFEKAIRAFEQADEKSPPPAGGVVCVGSSSIVGWHATIAKDLAPLKIIARGFGGSNMNDALYYVDRVVLKYRPRAVVVYEGDNDIASGVAPAKFCETFSTFEAAIHKALPDTRIYVLSIKPSPSRTAIWPKAVEANRLLAAACAADKRMTFVNVADAMTSADGKPREDIFKPDRLHMTAAGYAIWRDVLKPVLLKRELVAEMAGK